MFAEFARWTSKKLGSSNAFFLAVLLIAIWLFLGPFFHFSDSWQLIVNTATTIVTFLMVFLIQNTQNRDNVALHLKLDEIIRAMKNTHNEMLQIEELSDAELNVLHKRYESLADETKKRIRNGKSDIGIPKLKK